MHHALVLHGSWKDRALSSTTPVGIFFLNMLGNDIFLKGPYRDQPNMS